MTNEQKIKRVYCADQMASNMEGAAYVVGWQNCKRIEVEEDNLGTYGIRWFVAYDEQGRIIGKINALQVIEVEYAHD